MKGSFLAIFALLLFSCRKENAFDCFKGSGRTVTESRALAAFEEIRINDKFETHLVQSTEYRVEVSCGEHIIKNIKTTSVGGTLTVVNDNKCNFVRGYNRQIVITIFTPSAKYVINDGVGALYIDEHFKQDSISVQVASSGDFHVNGEYRVIKTSSNGNGDMYLEGKTKTLFVYTHGINYVDAKNLEVSDYMFIHTVTIGDCYINAENTRQFDCKIENSGNIYYTGNPTVLNKYEESSALGQLIHQP